MSNQFLPFATSGGANALTPAEWAGLTAILANGFQSGVASSEQFNTAFRQALAGTNLLGNFINDQGFNALDDGNTVNLLAAFKSALQNLLALKAGATGQAFQAADGATGKQVVNISQFGATFGASGIQRLPSGFILQWSTINIPGPGGVTWTYPTPFPNAVHGVFGMGYSVLPTTPVAASNTPGLSSVGIDCNSNSDVLPAFVFAIGR